MKLNVVIMFVATMALMIACVRALPWWGGAGAVVFFPQALAAWVWVVADIEDRKKAGK